MDTQNITLQVQDRLRWVRLSKYCKASDDTPAAVHKRRRRRVWVDGTHCKVVDGNLWVNVDAVNRWVEGIAEGAPS